METPSCGHGAVEPWTFEARGTSSSIFVDRSGAQGVVSRQAK
jgi:hypothetical protein